LYIFWELSLINNLGFETIFKKDNKFMKINNKNYKIPSIFINKNINYNKNDVKEALIFNKALMNENFLFPNKLKLPLSRNILEKYYS